MVDENDFSWQRDGENESEEEKENLRNFHLKLRNELHAQKLVNKLFNSHYRAATAYRTAAIWRHLPIVLSIFV